MAPDGLEVSVQTMTLHCFRHAFGDGIAKILVADRETDWILGVIVIVFLHDFDFDLRGRPRRRRAMETPCCRVPFTIPRESGPKTWAVLDFGVVFDAEPWVRIVVMFVVRMEFQKDLFEGVGLVAPDTRHNEVMLFVVDCEINVFPSRSVGNEAEGDRAFAFLEFHGIWLPFVSMFTNRNCSQMANAINLNELLGSGIWICYLWTMVVNWDLWTIPASRAASRAREAGQPFSDERGTRRTRGSTRSRSERMTSSMSL